MKKIVALLLTAVMVLGWLLKRRNFLSDDFIKVANKLTFKVALPCMLFLDIGEMDPAQLLNGKFVLYAAAVSLVSILGIWLLTLVLMRDKRQVGAFVQGAYRSSAAVLGVALVNVQAGYDFLQSVVNGACGGLGFTLSIVLFASIRQRLEENEIPKSFRGFPIALIAAGLLALAFMGFSGLSFG